MNINGGKKDKLFAKDTGIMADISYELNDIIENNNLQILRLQKNEEANKQILTSLSHDVRTPLASLLGYLEAINNGILSDVEEKEYIEVVYRKANDLKLYIDMLFEWFKLNSKEQQFHFEIHDINEITREIIIDLLPIAQKSNIELIVNISEDELSISLDLMSYRRILNNLFQNAIIHGKCTQVVISVKKELNEVDIEISNNGICIPNDQLPYIFERLYKCDNARSNKGSGLGLSITKELIAALNGRITVSSQSEQTTFCIHLCL